MYEYDFIRGLYEAGKKEPEKLPELPPFPEVIRPPLPEVVDDDEDYGFPEIKRKKDDPKNKRPWEIPVHQVSVERLLRCRN